MNRSILREQAKRAMNTRGQKACLIIDHLVEALAGDPSAQIKRAQILTEIDRNPGVTQTELMHLFDLTKSAANRDIDWLFNFGCINRHKDTKDGRAVRLETCGYAKRALENVLGFFPHEHEGLQDFLKLYTKILKQDRPTLRDARLVSELYNRNHANRNNLLDSLYNGPATTDNRALKKLINDGVIQHAG